MNWGARSLPRDLRVGVKPHEPGDLRLADAREEKAPSMQTMRFSARREPEILLCSPLDLASTLEAVSEECRPPAQASGRDRRARARSGPRLLALPAASRRTIRGICAKSLTLSANSGRSINASKR